MMGDSVLAGFERISRRVYRHEPKVDASGFNNVMEHDPATILILGWADAKPRHLVKFTDSYRRQYPYAKIFLITATTISTFFAGQQAAKQVVKEAVKEIFCKPLVSPNGTSDGSPWRESASAAHGRILIHIFSNSGGINLEAVCLAFKDLTGTPTSPLPAQAIIFDSTPGGPYFWKELPRWSQGINVGLGSILPFPEFVTLALSWILVIFIMGPPLLFGQETLPARITRFLNDPENISKDCKRLYLYSKADALIDWSDVEENAVRARSEGFDVQLERFEESPHCGHMRMYPERYWGAITRGL